MQGRGGAFASAFLNGEFVAVGYGLDVDLTDLDREEVGTITRRVLVDETPVATGEVDRCLAVGTGRVTRRISG